MAAWPSGTASALKPSKMSISLRDSPTSTSSSTTRTSLFAMRYSRFGIRQQHPDGGALPALAFHHQTPIVARQDFLANGQAQPQSLSPLFGGIKRLKDVVHLLGRETGAVVLKGNCHLTVIERAVHLEAASLGHGLEGILDEIDEHVIQVRLGDDLFELRRRREIYLHPLVTGLKHHDLDGVLEQVEHRVAGSGRPLKRIGREHQALDAQGHLLETLLGLAEVAFYTLRVFFLDDGQRQITPDAVQRVVQLVGDAKGELAHD